jgi:hypothetical protein
MQRCFWNRPAICVAMALILAAPAAVWAQEHAHVHGRVSLNVAVDGRILTVQLEAPLDSLLGFEHRPRTDAQRKAAAALLDRMKTAQNLFRPDSAAQCSLRRTEVESDALQKPPEPGGKEDEHADLDASFEFECHQPERLARMEVGLFDAFSRIQRIEGQIAGANGQTKQTLQRPEKVLRLAR